MLSEKLQELKEQLEQQGIDTNTINALLEGRRPHSDTIQIKPITGNSFDDNVDFDKSPFYRWPALPSSWPPSCADGYREIEVPEIGGITTGRACVLENPTNRQQRVRIEAFEKCSLSNDENTYTCKAFHAIEDENTERSTKESAIRCLRSENENSEACIKFFNALEA